MTKFSPEEVAEHMKQLPEGWEVKEGVKIHKRFVFENFILAMKFVNQMAELAEAEGHHPDFTVVYNKVDVTLWTHAIGGLFLNDFIVAAKLEQLPSIKKTNK